MKDNNKDEISTGESSDESTGTRSSIFSTSLSAQCSSMAIKSDVTARIVSGSVGSILTSLLVTPLEVVKIRIQAASGDSMTTAAATATTTTTTTKTIPKSDIVNASTRVSTNTTAPTGTIPVKPCPRGCGTFVLYNGHLDCVLSKSWVSFFDPTTGKLKSNPALASASATTTTTAATTTSIPSNLGTIGMIRQIFAQEGLSGIYAGLRPTLVMAVPNTVLYFSAYDEIVWRLRQYYQVQCDKNRTSGNATALTMIPLFAGASARLLSSTVTAPFELLRTRQAAEIGTGMILPPNRIGMWQEFQYITQTEGGYRSLFQGLKPTLYRDVPFSAIYWVCIEQFRSLWIQRNNDKEFPHIFSPMEIAGQAFINGAVAGMIAAAVTTPFDVIKTRQQARSIEQIVIETSSAAGSMNASPNVVCNHNGMLAVDCASTNTTQAVVAESNNLSIFRYLRHIAQTEGVAALWKGNQARMLKVAPSCAIMISSYEFGKRLLQPEARAS